MTTLDELMKKLNITKRQTIYNRLKYVDIGDPVYEFKNSRKMRVFTKEQVEKIMAMPISKGGRGHKGWKNKL